MPVCSPVRRTFSDERSTGTFHSLGVLPKRKHDSSVRKPPVFHIPHDHDHDDDTDQPPSPPPVSVPFPRSSSPPSPPSVSLPSGASPRPQLSRGSSASTLLPNGKPLKSSLKSSSSSPAMLMPPQSQHMHLRSRSEPSSPAATPKNVHFPEKDYGLATVCVFNRSSRPASLSSPTNGNGDETETEGEDTPPVRFPFPPMSHSFNYEIDPTKSSPVPSRSPPAANLLLESLNISSPPYSSTTAPRPLLSGSILVYNLAFEKSVAVRFTLDDWQTVSEVSAHYVVSLSAPPSCIPPSASPDSQRGRGWDRFTFVIRLEDYAHSLSTRILWLAAHYHVNSTYPEPGSEQYGPGGEWWDNNGGANYRVEFRPIIPSPSFPRGKPRRETVSGPLPPPRMHARSPAITKDRPLNPITPSVPAQPANDGDGHSPLLRAGKLNLYNYAPPTVRVTPSVPVPSVDSRQISSPSSITKSEPSHSGNLQVPSHDESTSPASSTLSTPTTSPTITPRVIIGGHPATPTQPHDSSKRDDGISASGHISDWDWSAPSKFVEEGSRHHHTDYPPRLGRNDVSDSNSLYNAFVTQWCFAQGSPPSHSVYGDVGIMT